MKYSEVYSCCRLGWFQIMTYQHWTLYQVSLNLKIPNTYCYRRYVSLTSLYIPIAEEYDWVKRVGLGFGLRRFSRAFRTIICFFFQLGKLLKKLTKSGRNSFQGNIVFLTSEQDSTFNILKETSNFQCPVKNDDVKVTLTVLRLFFAGVAHENQLTFNILLNEGL